MTFEEFQKAGAKELRFQARECFDEVGKVVSWERKASKLLEAQFYMQELDRRHDSWISWRDLLLEIVVIFLIGWEIHLGIKQGNDEGALMDKQNAILSNLESSTQATADQLKQELALQYEVFINAQYDGSRGIALFNNSKSEIYLYGIRVANNPPRQNHGGPASIAEHTAASIKLEEYYPRLFEAVPQSGSIKLPFSLYLKNAVGEEHIVTGQMELTRQGAGFAGTTESHVTAEQWSHSVNLAPIP